MAEDQDKAQKTEEPTQKRLDEAREKGQVATSREVNHLLILAAGTLFLALLAPGATLAIADAVRPFISAPHALPTGEAGFSLIFRRLLGDLGWIMLLPALLFVGVALFGGVVQNGPMLTAEPLKPKLERISLVAGAKRLFSLRSLIEFAKGVVKVAVIGVVGVALLWPAAPALTQAAQLTPAAFLGLLEDLALRMLIGVTALVGVIAALDVLYQRFEHKKQLRMSRRDLKDEFKQTEGDPQIKARLKQLRTERARRRMMAEVPKATVVVTNPSHFAVALRYDAKTMAAPVLVAKGIDGLAARIRDVAREHAVPVVENPPLARALHAGVDLGQEVPPSHYQAVAEVIGYVLRLQHKGAKEPA